MDNRTLKILEANVSQAIDDVTDLKNSISDYMSVMNKVTDEQYIYEQFGGVEENLSEAIWYLEKAKKYLKNTEAKL